MAGKKQHTPLIEDDREPSLATVDPWMRLATAILVQAAADGKAGDARAIHWLRSEVGQLFCDGLEIDTRKWSYFVDNLVITQETTSNRRNNRNKARAIA